MSEEVVVIVDLGHEDSTVIKKDVESLGVHAIICEHDVSSEELDGFGDIKGIILNGGPHKMINGFRVDASEAVYESEVPMYAVDHASMMGVDLFTWPKDGTERRMEIGKFLSDSCGFTLQRAV